MSSLLSGTIEILFFAARISDILPLLITTKHGNVSGEVEFGMEFDCAFVFPIMRPVVLRQTEIDRCAVDRVKRIMKFESVPLPPCRKILAIAVAGQIFYGFLKTISGDNLKSC